MPFNVFNFYQYKHDQLKPIIELSLWYLCNNDTQSTGTQILSQVFAIVLAKYCILLTNIYCLLCHHLHMFYILKWLNFYNIDTQKLHNFYTSTPTSQFCIHACIKYNPIFPHFPHQISSVTLNLASFQFSLICFCLFSQPTQPYYCCPCAHGHKTIH